MLARHLSGVIKNVSDTHVTLMILTVLQNQQPLTNLLVVEHAIVDAASRDAAHAVVRVYFAEVVDPE